MRLRIGHLLEHPFRSKGLVGPRVRVIGHAEVFGNALYPTACRAAKAYFAQDDRDLDTSVLTLTPRQRACSPILRTFLARTLIGSRWDHDRVEVTHCSERGMRIPPVALRVSRRDGGIHMQTGLHRLLKRSEALRG